MKKQGRYGTIGLVRFTGALAVIMFHFEGSYDQYFLEEFPWNGRRQR